jgi:chromosome segregation ATPase
MKSNLPVIILLVLCLGLGVVVFLQNQHQTVQANNRELEFNSYSNNFKNIEEKYNEQKTVNSVLDSNLTVLRLKAANDAAEADTRLANTLTNLEEAQREARIAREAVAKAAADIADREKKIADLEHQNAALDTESTSLHSQISDLNSQITAAKKQLGDATRDKQLVSEELLRLESQKEDLERRLSDVAALKEQITTVRDNLSIARRLTWMQRGIYDNVSKKGGELLIAPAKPVAPDTNRSLDVELLQGGGFRINSSPSTNPPSRR